MIKMQMTQNTMATNVLESTGREQTLERELISWEYYTKEIGPRLVDMCTMRPVKGKRFRASEERYLEKRYLKKDIFREMKMSLKS